MVMVTVSWAYLILAGPGLVALRKDSWKDNTQTFACRKTARSPEST
jgi:hypothetical protein